MFGLMFSLTLSANEFKNMPQITSMPLATDLLMYHRHGMDCPLGARLVLSAIRLNTSKPKTKPTKHPKTNLAELTDLLVKVAGPYRTRSYLAVQKDVRLSDMYLSKIRPTFRVVTFDTVTEATEKLNALMVSDDLCNDSNNGNYICHYPEPTQTIIYNVTHFQSLWNRPFDPILTQTAKFNARQETMMIQNNIDCLYVCTSDWQLLEKECSNTAVSVGFALPHTKISHLTCDTLMELIALLKPERLGLLKIPKFTTSYNVNLIPFLRSISTDDLSATEAEQKIVVEINEGVPNPDMPSNAPNSNTPNSDTPSIGKFILDRPFIYYVRYKPDNIVVFTGTYS